MNTLLLLPRVQMVLQARLSQIRSPTYLCLTICKRGKSYLLIIIVIVLWDKNVMLLKQSSKVLANECPNIEKGDHNGEHTEKTKGHFHWLGQNGAAASDDD